MGAFSRQPALQNSSASGVHEVVPEDNIWLGLWELMRMTHQLLSQSDFKPFACNRFAVAAESMACAELRKPCACAGARLIDMVVSPHALIESGGRLRLHASYYITKQIIPALERVVSLVGADMRSWYATMPRPQRLLPRKRPAAALGLDGGRSAAGTIDAYYLSRHCAVRFPLKPACARQRPPLPALLVSFCSIEGSWSDSYLSFYAPGNAAFRIGCVQSLCMESVHHVPVPQQIRAAEILQQVSTRRCATG